MGLTPVNLDTDGDLHSIPTFTFEFDASLYDNFDVKFEISNGELQLSDMEYTIQFKCLDLSDKIRLQQDFEIEYPLSLIHI